MQAGGEIDSDHSQGHLIAHWGDGEEKVREAKRGLQESHRESHSSCFNMEEEWGELGLPRPTFRDFVISLFPE